MLERLENRIQLDAQLASGVLTITGGAGAIDDVITVTKQGTNLVVAQTPAGSGQTSFLATSVTKIVVDAGDGNDTVNLAGVGKRTEINGGAGNDTLTGGSGSDTISGGAGDDVINGGAGKDSIAGGDGNDTLHGDAGGDLLVGGPGSDVFDGGDGPDIVSYAAETANLKISLDGVANDGATGENDSVQSTVEGVIGGNGND